MKYTKLTTKAMNIAYEAHKGQYDKMGVPYIFHPIHLAEQMDDEYSICVALLHDVVEDTAITLKELEMEFPKEIVDAVALLTHKKEIAYEDYVRNIKKNPLAKKVKSADIAHNSAADRLSEDHLDYATVARLKRKYKRAQLILNDKIK